MQLAKYDESTCDVSRDQPKKKWVEIGSFTPTRFLATFGTLTILPKEMFVHCSPIVVWIKNDFSGNRHPLEIGAGRGPFLCCSDLGETPGSGIFCSPANDPTRSKVNLSAIFTFPTCIDRNLECRCIILPAHNDIPLEIPFSHQERKCAIINPFHVYLLDGKAS